MPALILCELVSIRDADARIEKHLVHAVRSFGHLLGYRFALALIGVENAVGRESFDHQRKLPAQIESVLHASIHTLPAGGGMNMCGVATQYNTIFLVRIANDFVDHPSG